MSISFDKPSSIHTSEPPPGSGVYVGMRAEWGGVTYEFVHMFGIWFWSPVSPNKLREEAFDRYDAALRNCRNAIEPYRKVATAGDTTATTGGTMDGGT